MKVKLLVNLKIENGVELAGTIYDNANGPFPDFVERNLGYPTIFQKLIVDIPNVNSTIVVPVLSTRKTAVIPKSEKTVKATNKLVKIKK
jgi:hypothetical protein